MGYHSDNNRKIALIGPFPPPYGGISIHIQRMTRLLPENSFDLYNTSKVSQPGYYRFYGKIKYIKALVFLFRKYRLIHVHATDNILRIVFGFIGLARRNIYIHLHGMSHLDFLESNHPGGWLLRKLIPRLHILAVNNEIAGRVSLYRPASVRIADAFLPPVLKPETLERVVLQHRDFFSPNRFIICMTGWFSSYQGRDLYGFDMAAKMIQQLHKEGRKIFLVACTNGIRNKNVYSHFLNYIKKNHIENHVLVIENAAEAWPYMLLSNAFIRPTITDGSSVSVKEAIWLEVPVIASDCVKRPGEVILFKNRSVKELIEKVVQLETHQPVNAYSRMEKAMKKDFTCSLIKDVYGL